MPAPIIGPRDRMRRGQRALLPHFYGRTTLAGIRRGDCMGKPPLRAPIAPYAQDTGSRQFSSISTASSDEAPAVTLRDQRPPIVPTPAIGLARPTVTASAARDRGPRVSPAVSTACSGLGLARRSACTGLAHARRAGATDKAMRRTRAAVRQDGHPCRAPGIAQAADSNFSAG